jgi:hypothetical protein
MKGYDFSDKVSRMATGWRRTVNRIAQLAGAGRGTATVTPVACGVGHGLFLMPDDRMAAADGRVAEAWWKPPPEEPGGTVRRGVPACSVCAAACTAAHGREHPAACAYRPIGGLRVEVFETLSLSVFKSCR